MFHNKTTLVLLLILFIFAAYLRIFPLQYSHFWDEAVYLQHARMFIEGRTNYSELDMRPPFISVLYAFGFLIWDNIYVANIVQGLITALVVPISYLFMRENFTQRSAVLTALLFAFSPYLVDFSHNLLTNSPAVTLMMASVYLYSRSDGKSHLGSGIMFGISVLTRFTSLFLVVFFALQLLLTIRQESSWKRMLLFSIGSAAVLVPYMSWAYVSFGDFAYTFKLARHIIIEYLPYVNPSKYYYAFFEIFLVVALLGLLAWLAGVVLNARTLYNNNPTFVSECALFFWGILYVSYMMTIPVKETRYLLPLYVAVLPLSGLGIDRSIEALGRRSKVFRNISVGSLALALAVEFSPSFTQMGKGWVDDDVWVQVEIAQYISSIANENEVIYARTSYPVFAYYSEIKTIPTDKFEWCFDDCWQDHMVEEGFYVHARSDEGKDAKPQREFLDRE